MRSSLALVVACAFALVPAAFAGCRDAPEDGAPEDASASSSGTVDAASAPRKDAGAASSSGGASSFCIADAPVAIAGYAPPAAGQGVCTSAEIDQAFEVLLTAEGDEIDSGPLQGFVAAHPECTTCLVGASDWDGAGSYVPPENAPAPAVLLLPGGGTLLNEGACWAAAAGLDETCAQPVMAETACVNGTCGGCPTADFAQCKAASLEVFCEFADAGPACTALLDAKKADVTAACGPGTERFEPYFKRIASYLCGGT